VPAMNQPRPEIGVDAMRDTLPSGVPEQIIPLQSKKRDLALTLQKVQHVVPALPLLAHGIERLGHDPHGASLALGIGEVTISALVLGAFVRHLRSMRSAASHGEPHATHGVDWVDLLIGAMLAIEVWAHWHETGHIKRPLALTAVVMVILGLVHGRIMAGAARRQSLRIDEDGLRVGKPFRRFQATWNELAAVDIEPDTARLTRKDGKRYEVNFKDLRNAADVRAALEGARLRLPAPVDPEAAATPETA
jgi:hypothetical protein